MLDQSITNQMSIYSNPVSIRCQSIPIRCWSCDNSSQLDADPLPARRQSYAKSIPNPLSIQLDVNSVPIQCWPEADLLPIRCTNRVPIHPNPVSIRCQSGSNPFQFDANPMPIQRQPDANQAKKSRAPSHGGQSFANPMSINKVPIHPNQMQIRCQSYANQTSIKHQSIALWCQSIPIGCQSSTNPVSNKLQSIPAAKINPVPI